MGIEDGTVTQDSSLVISYKTKHVDTIQNHSCTTGQLPPRNANYVHIKTCVQMFIAALFIIAPKWKEPRCPSMSEYC